MSNPSRPPRVLKIDRDHGPLPPRSGAPRRKEICAKTLKSLIWRKEGEDRQPSFCWDGPRFSGKSALPSKKRLFPLANAAISQAAITAPEECGA
jgi:hypothetical protein